MITDVIFLKEMRAAAGGARLLLTVEIGEGDVRRTERLAILSARLERMPRVGALDEDTYARLLREAQVSQAIERGMRCLGAAGASRAALAAKLIRRGIAQDVAKQAAGELARLGYLDEVRGAEAEVRKGLAKRWGNRRILADLRAKGYGRAALAEAERALALESEEARLAALLQKKPRPLDGRERERLVASLVRYGYEPSMVEHMLGEE